MQILIRAKHRGRGIHNNPSKIEDWKTGADTVKNITKLKSFCTLLAGAVTLCGLQANAQETEGSGSAAASTSERKNMFQLFMTGEQRRLLEAVRQGLLRDEQLDRVREINTVRLRRFEEQNAEEVALDDFISFDNPQIIEQRRSIDFRLDGFIRIGGRNSTLLINGRYVDADNIKGFGLDANAFASDKESEVMLVDSIREQRVVLRPGQTLPIEGGIQEKYVSILQEEMPSGASTALESEGAEIDVADVIAAESQQ